MGLWRGEKPAESREYMWLMNGRDAVSIENGDEREVINNLVGQYEYLFCRASREVCREAAATLIADLSPEQIPSSLR